MARCSSRQVGKSTTSSKEVGFVEKRYYTADSLRTMLDSFERRYEFESSLFYEAHYAEDEAAVGHIPRFLRHSWASFYRDWQRLSGDDFAASVEHELELGLVSS